MQVERGIYSAGAGMFQWGRRLPLWRQGGLLILRADAATYRRVGK